LTVERALIHAASVQGIADAEVPIAVNRTVQQLGIANKLGSLCSELSRGQRQRVAIAQALIHSPSLLILDEPASGLDPEARHELAVLFRQLRAGGMTLLVSSHILAELEEYSTHMLVMRAGRIVETRVLQAEGATAGSRRIRVTLAQDVTAWLPGIRSSLQLLPGTELLSHAANHVICEIPDDDQAQSGLLQSLVQAHVPVIAFAEERENLQESYLRTLKAPTAAQEA
jgi:ABC-2 type transport system ATP-binding protein